ncbi:LPXTG cell wall anchor domain-containing protein [Arcanobacterium haemolyticum]|nr:LPXTG cell wall anchor domain-containing protein [Arcanobacterium haemolyticum]
MRVKSLWSSLAVGALVLGMMSAPASAAAPGPNPYANATLSAEYDGTGQDTPSQTFVTTKNGFVPGDDTSTDGVVASGDLVGLRSKIVIEPGVARAIQVRYTIPTWLEYDPALNPNLGRGNDFVTASEPVVSADGTTVVVTYSAKRGVPVSLEVPLTLRAKDTAGTAQADQVVTVETASGSAAAYSTSSTKSFTVVSAPSADIMIRPQNYSKGDNGTPYISSGPVPYDQKTFDLEIYPRPVGRPGQDGSKGASAQAPWSGKLDVSQLPEGTTFSIGGVTVAASDGMLPLPETTGSLIVTLHNTSGWGISELGSEASYPVHVVLDDSAFSTESYRNNGNGWQPGQGKGINESSANENGTNASAGYYVANNDWTLVNVESPAPEAPFQKYVLRPYLPGHSWWDEGSMSFAVGSERGASGQYRVVAAGTQLRTELAAKTHLIEGDAASRITLSDQWDPKEQTATGPVSVSGPGGVYTGDYTVQWYVAARSGWSSDIANADKSAGWVTSLTPPAGANAVRVVFASLPVGAMPGAGTYTVSIPMQVTEDYAQFGDSLPKTFDDALVVQVGTQEPTDGSVVGVIPVLPPEPTGTVTITSDTDTVKWENPQVTYTVSSTVNNLPTTTKPIATRMDVVLDACISSIDNVASGWVLDSVEYGDCLSHKAGKATFLVGGDGQWMPSNYNATRDLSVVSPLTFTAGVSRLALGAVNVAANWVLSDYEDQGRTYTDSTIVNADAVTERASLIETTNPKTEVTKNLDFVARVSVVDSGRGLTSETIIELPTNTEKSELPANWDGATKSNFNGSYTLANVKIDEANSVPGTTLQYLVNGAWTPTFSEKATQIKVVQPQGGQQGASVVTYSLVPSGNKIGDTYLTWISGAAVAGTTSPAPWPAENSVVASTVSGYVYWDASGSGTDRIEASGGAEASAGIAGVKLGLFKGETKLAEATTASDGSYSFDRNFVSGDYKVRVLSGVPVSVDSAFYPDKKNTVKQTYSYRYKKMDASSDISDTVNLGIDQVFENVNFGYFAADPHVDTQKQPATASCVDGKCTLAWPIEVKNDGNTAQTGVKLTDVIAGDATDVTMSYGMPAQYVKFKDASTAAVHVLARDTDDAIWGWGWNYAGQVGNSRTDFNQPTPVIAKDGTPFTSFDTSWFSSFGIDESGQLWAWGRNDANEVLATTDRQPIPVKIMQGHKLVSVSASLGSVYAIDTDGGLWNWNGRQGVQIKPGTKFSTVTASTNLTGFAIDTNGQMWAWGRNGDGQLGDGTKVAPAEPVKVAEGTKFKSVVTTASTPMTTLAIDVDGGLWAWGSNAYGQIGDGTTVTQLTPVQVAKGTTFRDVSISYYHVLAIASDGQLWAWGRNESGQIGDGTTTDRHTPAPVAGAPRMTSISTGSAMSMGVDTAGQLWGWGSGGSGNKLTSAYSSSNVPVQIKVMKSQAVSGQVIAPSSSSINKAATTPTYDVSTRTYDLPDIPAGQTVQVMVTAKVAQSKVNQVVTNQVFVSTNSNPKSGVKAPALPKADDKNPSVAAKLLGNETCSAGASWGAYDTPGDQCDQVYSGIPGNPSAPDPGSVTGRVWLDADKADAVRAGSDQPVSGVAAYLMQGDTLVASTITATDGTYSFANVQPGSNYSVSFEVTDQSVVDGKKLTDEAYAISDRPGNAFAVDTVAPRASGSLVQTAAFAVASGAVTENVNTAIDTFVPAISVQKAYIDESGKASNDVTRGPVTNPADQAPTQVTSAEVPVTVTVTNTGDEPLSQVTFSDDTVSGDAIATFRYNGTTFTSAQFPYTLPGLSLAPGARATVTGTLTMATPQSHKDTVTITGTGVRTGSSVTDDDTFTATAEAEPLPEPSISITKRVEGKADETRVEVGPKDTTNIVFTVTNTGQDDLIDPTLVDTTTSGNASVGDITCTWEKKQLKGIEHDALLVGTSATCTAQLPPLGVGATHSDTVSVYAAGLRSGKAVDASDSLTVTTPATVSVKLSKVDGFNNDAALDGATLVVTGGDLPAEGLAVQGGHEWTVELKPGEYTLGERVAPDGYARLPYTWTFTVSANDEISAPALSNLDAAGISLSGKTITVKNYPEGKLPATGSTQMVVYGASVVLLLVIATAILVATRRKKDTDRQ